jgi:hypothetical protein
MSRMQRQSLIAYGQPLCETVADSNIASAAMALRRGSSVVVRLFVCSIIFGTGPHGQGGVVYALRIDET